MKEPRGKEKTEIPTGKTKGFPAGKGIAQYRRELEDQHPATITYRKVETSG